MSITLPAASSIRSRDSGVAPLGVFFDATGTTGSVTTRPFHELHYRWNFGDGSSGNWSITGKSKNIAKGPMAAHIYESAGTFTWTLWVKDTTGTVESTSGQITVTSADSQFAGSKTYCFSTGTDFTGAPGDCPPENKITTSSWTTIKSYLSADRRLLLKRGDTWTGDSQATLPTTGPGIFGAFGSGNKPIINISGEIYLFVFPSGYTPDWRLMDLKIKGSGSPNVQVAVANGGTSAQNRSLCIRLDIEDCQTSFGTSGGDYVAHEENFIVECKSRNASGWHIYYCCSKSAFLGNDLATMVGNGAHLIRVWAAYKLVISFNSLDRGTGGMTTLKLHADPDFDTEYVIFSYNEVPVYDQTIDFRPQNSESNEKVKNGIIERNKFSATSITDNCVHISAREITVRNNLTDVSSTQWLNGVVVDQRGIEPAPNYVFVYNNTFYKGGTGGSETYGGRVSSGTSIYWRNNMCVFLAGGTTAQVINNIGDELIQSNNYLTTANDDDFVDAPNGDFRLVSGSSCKDGGYSVPVLNDYGENSRPVNSTWDIGAYEYGGLNEDEQGMPVWLFRM